MQIKQRRRWPLNWDDVCKAYIVLFAFTLLCFFLLTDITIIGEMEDSLLPTVSLLREQNFGISQADMNTATFWFPDWKAYLEQWNITNTYDLRGERLTAYFPTYSIVSTPVLAALVLAGLPKEHTFALTNILCLFIMLWLVERHAKTKGFTKLLLLLALSLNPVLPYIGWASMEVLVYCLLVLAVFYWMNKKYHAAAIFLSIAGTMNLTVMATGFFMILDYLLVVAGECPEKGIKQKIAYLFKQWWKIIRYGCCYLIVFIPFIYNYIHAGTFNLIIGGTMKKNPSMFLQFADTLGRAWAYVTDLNLGYVPYYLFALLIFVGVVIAGIIHRKYRALLMLFANVLTILCYSFFSHINCGMQGIARYNAWSVSIILIAVFYLQPLELDGGIKSKRVYSAAMAASMLFTTMTTGIYLNEKSTALEYTPIAEYILKNKPGLYSPLPSTFNSRTRHIDGGYQFDTPIVYADEWTNKILLKPEQGEEVLAKLHATDEQLAAARECLEKAKSDEYVYLSFADSERVLYAQNSYPMGTVLNYAAGAGELNGKLITAKGLSGAESGFTWTQEKKVRMIAFFEDYQGGDVRCQISYADVFMGSQYATIYCEGKLLFDGVVKAPAGKLEFTIPAECVVADVVNLSINLPQAESPGKWDGRLLGLAIKEIVFSAE